MLLEKLFAIGTLIEFTFNQLDKAKNSELKNMESKNQITKKQILSWIGDDSIEETALYLSDIFSDIIDGTIKPSELKGLIVDDSEEITCSDNTGEI